MRQRTLRCVIALLALATAAQARMFKAAPIPFPFEDFNDALDEGLFGEPFEPPAVQARTRTTGKQVVVELTIPGLDKDSLDIEVKDARIRIAYDARTVQAKKDGRGREYFRSESRRHFEQIIPVPAEAEAGKSRLAREGDTVKIVFPKRSALAWEADEPLRS